MAKPSANGGSYFAMFNYRMVIQFERHTTRCEICGHMLPGEDSYAYWKNFNLAAPTGFKLTDLASFPISRNQTGLVGWLVVCQLILPKQAPVCLKIDYTRTPPNSLVNQYLSEFLAQTNPDSFLLNHAGHLRGLPSAVHYQWDGDGPHNGSNRVASRSWAVHEA